MKKIESAVVKRRYAVVKVQEKYGEKITPAEIRNHLKEEYSINASWHTVERDLAWLETHKLDDYSIDKKKTLQELEWDELTTQLNHAKELEIRAKEQGNLSAENTAIKTQKEIVAVRRLVSRDMEELRLEEEAKPTESYKLQIVNKSISVDDHYKRLRAKTEKDFCEYWDMKKKRCTKHVSKPLIDEELDVIIKEEEDKNV